MPLYTYVVQYKGKTYVEQDRRSNYRAFAAMALGRIMENSMAMQKTSVQEAVGKAMRTPWAQVPNRSNVWRQSFDFRGSELEMYSILSKD